nr:rED3_294 [Cloning vector pHEN2-rED3_294]
MKYLLPTAAAGLLLLAAQPAMAGGGSLEKLKMKGLTYTMCDKTKFTWKRIPTDSGHDTVVMEVAFSGTKPCRIPVRAVAHGSPDVNVAMLITPNPTIENNGGGFIEMQLPPGDNIIYVGELSHQWFQKGSHHHHHH